MDGQPISLWGIFFFHAKKNPGTLFMRNYILIGQYIFIEYFEKPYNYMGKTTFLLFKFMSTIILDKVQNDSKGNGV